MSANPNTIRFSGIDVPCHKVWSKLEVLSASNHLLERLNHDYPSISSPFTLTTVDKVKNILADLDYRVEQSDKQKGQSDLENYAQELLAQYDPETVVEKLAQDKGIDTDVRGLISLVGSEIYLEAVTKEAGVLRENGISPDQIAELWNDQKRPSPDSSFWQGKTVSALLGM